MEKEAPKVHLPKPETHKTLSKPEISGETIFIGEAKPVEEEKPKEEKKVVKSTEPPKKVIGKEAPSPAKAIIEKAIAKDPIAEQALSKPIKNVELEDFVAKRLEAGKSLVQLDREIGEALRMGRFSANPGEAIGLMGRIEEATGVVNKEFLAFGAPSAVEDLFPSSGSDPIITNPELAKLMKGIQEKTIITSITSLPVHDTDIPSTVKEISRGVESGKWPKDQAEEAARRIQNVIDEIEDRQLRARYSRGGKYEELDPFNTISLEEEGMKALIVDPDGKIESELRKLEDTDSFFPEDTGGHYDRLHLFAKYIESDRFLKDIDKYVAKHKDDTNLATRLTEDDAKVMKEKIRETRKKLSEKITMRTNIQKAYGMIRLLGDPEKVKGTVLNIGEKGIEYLLCEGGGVVDVAFNKYVRLLKQARFDEKGNLRRYDAEVLRGVHERVIEELKQEHDLYEGMYSSQYKGLLYDGTDDSTCRSIAKLAEYAAVLTQQDLAARLGGLGPGETGVSAGLSSLSSPDTAEHKLLPAMDLNRYNVEKFMALKESQLTIYQNMCRFATQASGRSEYVQERFRDYQHMEKIDSNGNYTEEYKKLLAELLGIKGVDKPLSKTSETKDKETVRSALERVFRFDSRGRERKPSNFRKIGIENLPGTIEEITDKLIYDRFVVVEGEKVIGEMLGAYDHYSSTWRLGQHLTQVANIWGKEEDSEGAKLALGFRLREVGNKLLGAKTNAEKKAVHEDLEKILRRISIYRPQALLEFLTDHHFEGAEKWFENNKANFSAVFGQPVERVDQLYDLVNRRFIATNELLAQEGLPPIDYSKGLTGLSPKQLAEVTRVLGHQNMEADIDGFMDLMKQVSEYTHDSSRIAELTKERYHAIYRRTRWVDDSRLRFLENISGIKNVTLNKNALPFSAFIGRGPGGENDPLPRTWGDLGQAASVVLPKVWECLQTDPKKLFDAESVIVQTVRKYAGDPHGTRAGLYILAGWTQTAETDSLLDWFSLNMLEDSSAMKRMFGPDAPSMGRGEIDNLIEEYGVKVFLEKLKILEPSMSGELEKWVGFALGHGENKIMLHAYRLRLFIALAMLVLIAQSMKSATQGEGKH